MSKGATTVHAGCYDCDKEFPTNGTKGRLLAQQHATKTGHRTWAEVTKAYTYGEES